MKLRVLGGLLVAALALTTAVACEQEGAGPEEGATVEDLTTDEFFNRFTGLTVTVSGRVTSTVADRGFRLSGDDVAGEGLLVISAQQAQVDEGDVVQVTGTVRRFVIVDIEQEFGFDLEDDAFTEFGGEPVLVAQQVDQNVPQDTEDGGTQDGGGATPGATPGTTPEATPEATPGS